jgi:hypothetical protein
MNVFTQTTGDAEKAEEQTSFLEQLVKVKGENWKDTEVLAKGKLEADAYIAQLEEQAKQLREDLAKQDYAKQLIDQLQNKATESAPVKTEEPNNNNSGTHTDGNTQPKVSGDDLKSLVSETMSALEKEKNIVANVTFVSQELEKTHGNDATAFVARKAQELGMSLARLEEIAKESPTAFFTLIGEAKKDIPSMIKGSIKTEAANITRTDERNWNYYQELRRKDKSLYYNPKTQQQMLEDKKRLGRNFGL